jgi:SAM-dependent methyltransferase
MPVRDGISAAAADADVVAENHKRYLERVALFKRYGYDSEAELDFVIEKAQPVFGEVLEAGTGKGYFALALARKGYRFTSFDISPEEQRFARLNLAYYGLENRVDFLIEDAARLSFPNRSFDVIFLVNVLHHLARPDAVADECARVLTLEGKIVLSDFTREGFEKLDKLHESEGRRHQKNDVSVADIGRRLTGRGFQTVEYGTGCQHVLIAYRKFV